MAKKALIRYSKAFKKQVVREYTSGPYRQMLAQHHIRSSMGQVGNYYDNAVAERINGILKFGVWSR